MHEKISGSRSKRLNARMIGIAALVLLGMVAVSYHEWRQYGQPNAVSVRNGEVAGSVDSLLFSLVDAETGQRGFLLTGESRYLRPYDKAIGTIPGELAHVNSLLAALPGESANRARLDALVAEKLAELRQTIEARRAQAAQPAVSIALSGQGKREMDEIRALGAAIQQRANSARSRISHESETAAATALLATVAGSLVLLFLLVFGLDPLASPDPMVMKRSWALRYGVAVLAVAAAALLRTSLTPIVGARIMPFTLFYPAIWFAAWFAGFRPGLLSIALSLPIGDYFFAQPPGTFLLKNSTDRISALFLVIVGFGMALLSRSQEQAVKQATEAESAERNERQRFETTLASIGDAVIATDARGKVTFVNKVASALLRASETDVIGRHLDDVFHIVNELTRSRVESPVTKVLREAGVVALANHTVLIAHDGTETPIDDSAAPIRTGDGPIVGTVLVFRDITARRRAEQATALLASIVESSDDAIASKDLNGLVTSWNKGAESIYGFSAREMIGKPISLLAPPGRQNEADEILDRIQRGERVEHYRTLRSTKSGNMIHVSITASPVRNAIGEIAGASLIARDITRQVEAEAQIAEQRERLRVTLNSIGDAVLATDAAGRVTFVNKVACSLLRAAEADVLGRPSDDVFRIINESTRATVESPIMKVLREGGVVALANHTVLLAQDGTEVPIDDSGAPIRAQDGTVLGTVLVFRDITERRRAESVSRLLASVVESSADGIITKDLNGIVTTWNIGAERIFGYSAHEIVGQPISVIVPPDLASEMPTMLGRIQNGETIEQYETIRQTKDGKLISVSTTWSPIRDAMGRIVGASKVVRDITERKQAEERFRLAVEAAPNAMIMVRRDGRIELINSQTERVFGYERLELLGKPVDLLVPERFRTGHGSLRASFQLNPSGRPMGAGRELYGLRKDGCEVPIEVGLSPISTNQGDFFLAAIVDITDRKRADEARRESDLRAHLLHIQDEERRRIGRELHDSVGQNLVILKMDLDSLASNSVSAEAMRKKLDECIHLASLAIKEIRTTSYAMYPPMLEETGLRSAIPMYLDGIKERSGVAVRFEISPDVGRLSRQMELALFRVIQESLTNVLKHSGSSAASVRLGLSDSVIRLEVQDRGRGFPADVLDAFNRGLSVKLGVGLRGMNERIRHIGGKLEVSSAPGGTTVSVEIPLSASLQIAE